MLLGAQKPCLLFAINVNNLTEFSKLYLNPSSQLRFLHPRKTPSFRDTTADLWHAGGRDTTGKKHFQLKAERDNQECQQQGWGHGTPGHMQSVCGAPATHSSVSGQPGTKRNSSRAAVPRSQRMERDKQPQHPAFLAFKDVYSPFHTQLSQNASWMLLQTQRSPGRCLISHTMIWIQALIQKTQACWIASSVVIQTGFLVRLPTPQQWHKGKAVLAFFRGKTSWNHRAYYSLKNTVHLFYSSATKD